jgi:uncharacterized protein
VSSPQPTPPAPLDTPVDSGPAVVRLGRWLRGFARRHGRFTAFLGVVVVLLVTINIGRTFGPAGTGLVVGPIAAAGLLALGRRAGLTWSDLGLCRRTWLRGAAFGLGAVAAVVGVYAAAAALPFTRAAFLDVRYEMPAGRALLTALVLIPIGTVLLEEVAFRGVLLGLITRHRGGPWGIGLSSALFGAWHILPSLDLTHANAAVGAVAGGGLAGQVGAVLSVVVFTAIAGLLLAELRRRSGSILAAAGLHWAVNGVGVLVTALLYTSL